jgi:malonyl-CoA/methylmalonyl-CoA synthetase
MNVSDLLTIASRRVQEAADKTAIDFLPAAGEREELSYRELERAVEAMTWRLRASGAGKGDRVAFFLANRPQMAVAFLAAMRLGVVVVPINLAYRQREIAHILGDARPKLLLTEPAARGSLEEIALAERHGVEIITLPALPEAGAAGAGDTAEGGLPAARAAGAALSVPPAPSAPSAPAASSAALDPVQGDDLALLLYTSGTTGHSKGAMISHNNLLATITALLAAWSWRPDDVLLLALPLFHVHGLVVGLLCALAAGASVRLRQRFEVAAALAELAAGGPSLFFGVPTMYVRLVEEMRRRGGAWALPGVRLCCSGSAPLAAETFDAFRALTGHAILERYGMTEAGMILSNPYAGPRVAGQVGTPLPGISVRIVGDDGQDLPAGGEGELLVRGANVFRGYWQAPEKTAASFVADGEGRRWFRTGDLARQDAATGAFTLLGRRHELILCGGFNVYPREVEEVLLSLPGVREAAVVGEAHPEWGEVPVAYLVADPDPGDGSARGLRSTTGRLDEAALTAACKRQLAGFKVPRNFHLVAALPRNALGKVQKHLLRGLLAGA